MSHRSRADFAGAPVDGTSEAGGRAKCPAHASTEDPYVVEGEVLEVLPGYGLAHVRTIEGVIFGLNRATPGVNFADLLEGQRVRIKVTRRFNRVLHAHLVR